MRPRLAPSSSRLSLRPSLRYRSRCCYLQCGPDTNTLAMSSPPASLHTPPARPPHHYNDEGGVPKPHATNTTTNTNKHRQTDRQTDSHQQTTNTTARQQQHATAQQTAQLIVHRSPNNKRTNERTNESNFEGHSHTSLITHPSNKQTH